MGTNKEIGKAMKRAREGKNLMQSEVAEKVGINTNYYARIERGYVPSFATLEKISKVLGLKISVS